MQADVSQLLSVHKGSLVLTVLFCMTNATTAAWP